LAIIGATVQVTDAHLQQKEVHTMRKLILYLFLGPLMAVGYSQAQSTTQQAHAIEQDITQALTQLRTAAPIERSETSSDSKVLSAHTPNREEIIARIRRAKDVEGKSYQRIADELNAAEISTFSGKGTWEKGSVHRFYKKR
jgi:Recombinase